MTPWRRRLSDYAQFIQQADQTYFEPDSFRRNVQNAIQTARTVTWLIQNNKREIPNFTEWYQTNVLSVLGSDPIMVWLKDSRNFIEKQGDLDMFSQCSAELMFSYATAGPKLVMSKQELLPSGVKKIIRFAQKQFPAGLIKDSAIVIDRRWVANTLPDHELTDALQHGYDVLRRVVDDLDKHCGQVPPSPHELKRIPIGSIQRRAYVKISTGQVQHMSRETAAVQIDPANREELRKRYGEQTISNMFRKDQQSFADAFERICTSAFALFNVDGHHISLGFLLDQNFNPIQILDVKLDSHADKFIYWSEQAHWISLNSNVTAVIYVSEVWIRSLSGYPAKAISELTVLGEELHIVGLSKRGEFLSRKYEIFENEGKKCVRAKAIEANPSFPNFLVPLARVWGLNSFEPTAGTSWDVLADV